MSQPWTHSSPGAKAYERADDEWYAEPAWVSLRLFQEEPFNGSIYDPCCGMGTIVLSALAAGLKAYGSDIRDRGWDSSLQDFFAHHSLHENIVCNPPFDILPEFARHALKRSRRKVAMIFPVARLNAAHWLRDAPLARVWLLTPRPSMPPGRLIQAGHKPGGGKSDYCWIVLQHGYEGYPEMRWLRRDAPGEQPVA